MLDTYGSSAWLLDVCNVSLDGRVEHRHCGKELNLRQSSSVRGLQNIDM